MSGKGDGANRARIRRGPAPTRKRPTSTGRGGRVSLHRGPASSGRSLVTIPAPVQARIRQGGNYALALVMIGLIVAGIIAMKLPQMIGTEIGEAIGRAGFAVNKIEVRGLSKMDRAKVYDVALEQQSRAMPLVDLDAIRQRLLGFGWIQDARVSRRLPDTLVVDVVERRPAAIWQFRQQLTLVDEAGQRIAAVKLDAMPENLPLVVGPGANLQVAALERLIGSVPALKPTFAGASWIGGRRWDVRFQSGETLMLPEGDEESRAALAEFAQRDQRARLLGQGFMRFDMRVPGRIVARAAREPGQAIAERVAPAEPAEPAVADKTI